MGDSIDELEFLAGSPNRVKLLELLSEAREMEKHDLREASDSVRTTLSRNLGAMERRGWVQKQFENNQTWYAITPVGRAIAEGFSEFRETVQTTSKLADFLRWVPAKAFNLDPEALSDAEVIVAEPGDPWTMINMHVERIRNMDQCRAVLPLTGQHAHEAAARRVTEAGAKVEVIVTEEVFETHHSRSPYAKYTRQMVESGRVDYHVCQERIPYAVAVIDDLVHIGVSEGEDPRALVESKSPEVINWAHLKIDEFKRHSVTKAPT